jgi:hypothetical protein
LNKTVLNLLQTLHLILKLNKCLNKTLLILLQTLHLGLSMKSFPRLRLQGWPLTFLGFSLDPQPNASDLSGTLTYVMRLYLFQSGWSEEAAATKAMLWLTILQQESKVLSVMMIGK